MELTLEQYDILFGSHNLSGRIAGTQPASNYNISTEKYQLSLWDAPVSDPKHLWGRCAPGWKCVGVPYKLEKSGDTGVPPRFSDQQSEQIELAMSMVERHTCIRQVSALIITLTSLNLLRFNKAQHSKTVPLFSLTGF